MKICLSCEGVTTAQAPRCGHCGGWLLPTDALHYPRRRGEADSGNPLLGTVVGGKYRLQAVLGRGGLGTVFRAVHTGSLQTVAVKLLHPRFAVRPEYRRALLPEARRAAAVTHERCARILDVGEAEDGTAYLAMELVEGDTLEALVRGERLAPGHAVEVLRQIAEALAAIHAAGLVHCDLSPRNAMVVVRDGRLHVKVLDFGIARSVSIAGAERTAGGEFAGFVNPAFAAPELLAGAEVQASADLYSLGALAFWLLAGEPPVAGAEPRAIAAAAAAGQLRPWPRLPGVPRRLQALVRRCLAREPAGRPPSAAAVQRELAQILAANRPALRRSAWLAAATSAVLVALAQAAAAPPFLRPVPGTRLELVDGGPRGTTPAQVLTSQQLATLVCHFGGFAPARLRLDAARGGTVLWQAVLRPAVDAAGGTLVLDRGQAEWRAALDSLRQSSRDGPLDLAFVAPGYAPLAGARLCIDDEPPALRAALRPAGSGEAAARLTGATVLHWQAEDAPGPVAVRALVAFADGRVVPLPLAAAAGELPLGARLAEGLAPSGDLGAGEVRLVAEDRAGNASAAVVLPFAAADLRAPALLEVTGPAGEPFLPCTGGLLRARLRLAEAEPGTVLRIAGPDGAALPEVALPAATAAPTVEFPLPAGLSPPATAALEFTVVDAVGNQSRRSQVLELRERSPRGALSPTGGVLLGRELVVGAEGANLDYGCSDAFRVGRAQLWSGDRSRELPEAVELTAAAPGRAALRLRPLPPGSYRLDLGLDEVVADGAQRLVDGFAVRVLPPQLQLRVPAARSRFLPGVLAAGVLARSGAGYRDGPGWRIDPDLRPYLRGQVWLGGDDLAPVPLAGRDLPAGPLLPELQPVPGRNVVALELRDVLGRPVAVEVGDGAPRREANGREVVVIAEFFWRDAPPEPIGEELLVEFGQPAPWRVRVPLPFEPGELAELRLGMAQGEVAAQQLQRDGADATVVTFAVPYAMWSAAAALAGRRREDYGQGLTARLDAYLATPAGRHDFALRLRTTRSTLRPVRLQELGAVPEPLGALRLLPVLAPEGPFAEPVPAAPPRALYRPQPPVAVRNLPDLLLQEGEFTCGMARALLQALAGGGAVDAAKVVHAADPLGPGRLDPAALLPPGVAAAPADQPVVGIDYFQAHACSRLLGAVVAGDPELFRLPLGCELELAAYARARGPAAHGAAAAGGGVAAAAFRGAAEALRRGQRPTAADCRAAGDAVPTEFGAEFTGLDFGVREWVADLPHVTAAELLLGEWIGDHAVHLARVEAFAAGTAAPPADLAVALRTFGVVRGLALGELDGLLGPSGNRLPPEAFAVLPPSVPGVLRTEQLRRDGRDLLAAGRDPRLLRVGFRVAGTAALLRRLRGRT